MGRAVYRRRRARSHHVSRGSICCFVVFGLTMRLAAEDLEHVVAASGRVLEAGGREPVAGAVVSFGPLWTETASDGSFAIRVPPGRHRVDVWSAGHERESFSIELAANSDALLFRLTPFVVDPHATVIRASRDSEYAMANSNDAVWRESLTCFCRPHAP